MFLVPITGFCVLAGLLFTNHYGVAIKLSNYLFWIILAIVVLGLTKYAKD